MLDLGLRAEVEALRGDVGCRDLLRTREDVHTLEVNDPGILADVDTEADLADAEGALLQGTWGLHG